MRRPIPSRTSTFKLPTSSNGDDGGGPAKRAQAHQNRTSPTRTPVKRASRTARESCQTAAPTNPSHPSLATGRQATIRRSSCGLPLKHAVRSAVDVCFHFSFRTVHGEALWSATERVWLGKHTFLHWALWLADINIPWTVSTAAGAPHDAEQLRGAVLAELASYWADQIAALPRRNKPHWLPLP
jgi:hypothetical protein